MEICEPPEPRRKALSEHWITVVKTAKELTDRPEDFVKVGPYSVGVATNIRNGLYPAFLPTKKIEDKASYMADHWVITTRKCSPTKTHIYVRWIGDGCKCEVCG